MRCSRCNRDLPIGGFHRNRKRRSGYRNECRECIAAYMRAWRKKKQQDPAWVERNKQWQRNRHRERATTDPTYVEKRRNYKYQAEGILTRDGSRPITDAEVQEERLANGNKCAACGSSLAPAGQTRVGHVPVENEPCADHDHANEDGSGPFRSVICYSCNNTLGAARESSGRLVALAAYVARWNAELHGDRTAFDCLIEKVANIKEAA